MGGRASVLPVPAFGWVGVEPGAVAGGGGVGTLLGPEGSGDWFLWASFRAARVCVWVWLVGLLFEICIVDASILR